jgi:acid phosphatase
MRGTVAIEVLNCGVGSAKRTSDETYIRVQFNDTVYPIATCQNGPGKSCLLSEYISILNKSDKLMKPGLRGAITKFPFHSRT